jgi:hypothetical protein
VILFELAYLFLLYLFSILDHFFLSFDHANSRELKWGRGGCIAEDGFILAGTKDLGFHEVWRPEAGGRFFIKMSREWGWEEESTYHRGFRA